MRRRALTAAACSLLALGACGAPAEAPAPSASAATPSASPPSVSAVDAPNWIVDHENSTLGFSGTQTGTPFQGRFEKYEATIALDPDNLDTAHIDVVIDMNSAKTGDRQRDSALPGSDWFRTKDFPTARFSAARVEKKADGAFVAHGALTIRGIAKDLALPFTLTVEGNNATARGEVALLRTDYGVGQGDFADGTWVGIEVKVTVDIKATRASS